MQVLVNCLNFCTIDNSFKSILSFNYFLFIQGKLQTKSITKLLQTHKFRSKDIEKSFATFLLFVVMCSKNKKGDSLFLFTSVSKEWCFEQKSFYFQKTIQNIVKYPVNFRVGRGSKMTPKYWMLQCKNHRIWQVGGSKIGRRYLWTFPKVT